MSVDHFLTDGCGFLRAGEHADQQGLLFVQVEGVDWPSSSLDAFHPKVPVALKLSPVLLDDVLPDFAWDLHPEAFGQVRVEDAGLLVLDDDGEQRGLLFVQAEDFGQSPRSLVKRLFCRDRRTRETGGLSLLQY